MHRHLTKSPYLIWLVFLFGIGARFMAFHYNVLPHGDITLDYGAAYTWKADRRLVTPVMAIRPYLVAAGDLFGYPVDQHGPLWPILGGLGAFVSGDVYTAFKLLTLLAGCLLIPVSYLVFRAPFGDQAASLAAICITFSYVLIDYSGNGSLYIWHALLFLLFVGLSPYLQRWWGAALLGLIVGAAYLLNYQAIILLPVLLLIYLIAYWQNGRFRHHLACFGLSILIALIIVSPWFARNQYLFGNFMYSNNAGYIWSNLGIPAKLTAVGNAVISERDWTQVDWLHIIITAGRWTMRNTGYMILRLLILLPVLSIFSAALAWKIMRHPRQIPITIWTVLLIMLGHMAISCLWPVFKFRYFVPLLPLLCGWGSWLLLTQVKTALWRQRLSRVTVAAMIFVSIVTYLRVPSHTNYYDDNAFFHWRTGEAEWYADTLLYLDALQQLDGDGALLTTDYAAFYFTHRPVILLPATISNEALQIRWLRQFQARYLVAAPEIVANYRAFFPGTIVYENDGYAVVALPANP